MSDSQTVSSGPVGATPQQASTTRVRQASLFFLMLLMLGALWYDYKVARPAVATAYDRIARLNNQVNAMPGRKYMTEKDVQQELDRTPIQTFSDGGYFVEVYGWRAGLPIKTHNYYAVYTDGAPHIFLTHAMNQFDRDLIHARPTIQVDVNGVLEIPTAGMPNRGLPGPPGDGEDSSKEESSETESDARSESKSGGTSSETQLPPASAPELPKPGGKEEAAEPVPTSDAPAPAEATQDKDS